MTTEQAETVEQAILWAFWRGFKDSSKPDRLARLQLFADVRIHRPGPWDAATVRARHRNVVLFGDECERCGRKGRRLIWHHIIQIQHGGSNHPWNRMRLCCACHARVYPWLLEPPAESMDGLVEMGDYARYMLELYERKGGFQAWQDEWRA